MKNIGRFLCAILFFQFAAHADESLIPHDVILQACQIYWASEKHPLEIYPGDTPEDIDEREAERFERLSDEFAKAGLYDKFKLKSGMYIPYQIDDGWAVGPMWSNPNGRNSCLIEGHITILQDDVGQGTITAKGSGGGQTGCWGMAAGKVDIMPIKKLVFYAEMFKNANSMCEFQGRGN